MIAYLPLLAAFGCCLALLLPAVDDGADLVVTRVALSLFGDYVGEDGPRRQRQRDLMRAAHVAGTHRTYAAKTLLYAGVLGVAGSVIGVYAAAGLLSVLDVSEAALRGTLPASLGFVAGVTRLTELGLPKLFLLLTLASATLGAALAVGMYYGRWELLDQRAHARGAEIDATLPRTVAFMYALSRSGMPFPRVMDTLAENEAVYGEAATELSVAVRDMNAFGTDALTALQRTSRRTPSDDLADFAENLASVLGTGQPISTFLSDQYELYQEEAESKQQQYLELLSTFAEAYVTALVAGPLFFITILVVIGLVLEDTLPLLRVVVYLGVPLATFGFVVYVDSVTQGIGGTETVDLSEAIEDESGMSDTASAQADGNPQPDGGVAGGSPSADRWAASRERLRAYDRIRTLRRWAASPVESVLGAPRTVFLLSVPLAVVVLLVTAFPITLGPPTEMVAQVETPIVAATVVVLASYAVVYEAHKRRVRRIESAVPDFLDRLASVNEAGTSVVGSVRRVADSNLEALTDDLQRTRRDIDWGADVGTALRRLERRVRSPMTSRAVALITNAMRASGDVGPVLRIAADESRATWSLRRERRQVMLTYLIVIYISFLVFLGIIASLSVSFIPAIEEAAIPGAGAGTSASDLPGAPSGPGGITDGLGDINTTAYEQLFFHAAAIQAVCSGLVAGQLGEGSVRDGVKHVVALLLLTLATFLVIDLV
ncbi:type II secretion system F family protein [Halorubrum lacusprofundi]|jgi:flagellar protein FlaJ|uniref:Type II secretion system protein n=1 Tax=Halorubrum lacusprofundi (strain ATCC 49239 / DSM 5036 / JCM 8891 / ACAM 34) TaxID=416348 RepID=B9LMP0_HALLT|nr:type II secretion system F family protein [Halorubrum lacusprofundi]ACM56628.1 type II secretion system protein [Halorubrum lacusprofundi ATCC 49239]MCG1005107.1 type II secretion system F family protein [Halorubrum lacusprofundi]